MPIQFLITVLAASTLSACSGPSSQNFPANEAPNSDLGNEPTLKPILIEELFAGEWVQIIESSSTNRTSYNRIDVDGIDTTPTGELFATGYVAGFVDFGRPAHEQLESSLVGTRYTKDAFLAKYSSTGNLIFAKPLPSTGFEGDGYDLAVDNQGNAYISGAFAGQMLLEGTTLTSSCDYGVTDGNSGSNGQMFLAKYTPAGQLAWAIQSNSTSVVTGGNEVSIDSAGDVIQIGMMGGIPSSTKSSEISGCAQRSSTSPSAQINGQVSLPYDVGAGGYDTYISVYDHSNGNLKSGHVPFRVGGIGRQRGKAIDHSQDLNGQKTFVYGIDISGPTTLYASDKTVALNVVKDMPAPQEYSQNILVGRTTYSGKIVWQKSFGSTDFDEVKGIATDSEGNVILSGTISGNTTGITIDMKSLLPNASSAGFVMKLSGADGSVIWSRVFGGTDDNDYCCEVVLNEQNDIFLSVRSRGSQFYFSNLSEPLDFTGLLASDNKKGLTVKVSSGGDLMRVRAIPHTGLGADSQFGEMSYRNGFLYTSPGFYGEINVGGTPLRSAQDGKSESEMLIRLKDI